MLKRIIFKNFKSNLKNYLFFFLSNTLAVSLLLVFWGLKYNLGTAIKDEGSAYVMNTDFAIAAVMLSVVAVFLTVYAVRNYVKLRIRDYSMLTVLGIRKKTFQKIIFAEYGLGWLLSVMAGLLFGNIIYYIFQKVLLRIAPSFLNWSVIGLKPYLYTLIISLSIIIIVVMATLTIMEGRNLDTYAAGKEVREAKPKNWKWLFLVFVGIVLWVYGNIKFRDGDAGPVITQMSWLIAVFLILCIGGSIFMESLKKRKKFYIRNLFRLNQLYHHFSSNYLIVFMLFVLHFFALGYLANGIAECLPVYVDRSQYPYDYVWSAQEKDRTYMEEIAQKYHGNVKEIQMMKVATFNGMDNFGIAETTYEELTWQKPSLGEDEIMVVMENGEEGGEITSEITRYLYETMHLGKFRGEYVKIDAYQDYGYQKFKIKKIVSGNIIGQMIDGHRDSWIILPDKMFHTAMKGILNDPEEPSVLALFQIPEKYREQAGKELEDYVKIHDVEEMADLQSNFYSTGDIINGIESRNLFQFSSKFFIAAALMFSSIFILKMKAMSEEDMAVRRYSFLNCMGMRKKTRMNNLRFEIRSVAGIPLICGLFIGIDYAIVNWDAYRRMGEELPAVFWKMWIIIICGYLLIQFVGMEWVARTASGKSEKKIEMGEG